jgi:hypothetical protein
MLSSIFPFCYYGIFVVCFYNVVEVKSIYNRRLSAFLTELSLYRCIAKAVTSNKCIDRV